MIKLVLILNRLRFPFGRLVTECHLEALSFFTNQKRHLDRLEIMVILGKTLARQVLRSGLQDL